MLDMAKAFLKQDKKAMGIAKLKEVVEKYANTGAAKQAPPPTRRGPTLNSRSQTDGPLGDVARDALGAGSRAHPACRRKPQPSVRAAREASGPAVGFQLHRRLAD